MPRLQESSRLGIVLSNADLEASIAHSAVALCSDREQGGAVKKGGGGDTPFPAKSL